ncbi:unnamed protein product [Urochloa humidicola]
MHTKTAQPTSSSSAAAASASYPRWVVLENQCGNEPEGGSCTHAGNPKTVAACRTTTGRPISVSVRIAPPPVASSLCVQVANKAYASVVAAHGGSLLIDVGFGRVHDTYDMLVYNAGDAPRRPPTLSLLPPCYRDPNDKDSSGQCLHGELGHKLRYLDTYATGLVQRAGDIVVAELELDTEAASMAAQLVLLRSGEWSVKRPVIISNGQMMPSSWEAHAVVSVGDRQMCWADLYRGLIVCSNVLDEEPALRFVPLPAGMSEPTRGPRASSRDLCVTSDGTSVTFIAVVPRCCCGGEGATFCRTSHDAYTVRTWRLGLNDDTDTEWVMEGMVDATELWALDAYHGLPRVQLAYPIVSKDPDEPRVIFFVVCESFYGKEHGDKTEWLILVDMKSKTLRWEHRYDQGLGYFRGKILLPSSLSDYFNCSQSCSDGQEASVSKSNTGCELPPLAVASEQLTVTDIYHNPCFGIPFPAFSRCHVTVKFQPHNLGYTIDVLPTCPPQRPFPAPHRPYPLLSPRTTPTDAPTTSQSPRRPSAERATQFTAAGPPAQLACRASPLQTPGLRFLLLYLNSRGPVAHPKLPISLRPCCSRSTALSLPSAVAVGLVPVR